MLSTRNNKFNLVFVYTLLSCLVSLTSCSHIGTSKSALGKKLSLKKSIYLRLQPMQGRIDKTRHYSHSTVKTLKKGATEPEVKTEVVEFDISTELLLVDRGKAHLHYLISTLMKKELKGSVDLSELGFPKDKKTLSAIYYPNGSVVKVEGKDKDGIYYVPPISLPLRKVKVGDSWQLNHAWLTAKDKLPLKLGLESTLVAVHECPINKKKMRTCAEINIAGSIDILGLNKDKLTFKSEIKGKLIFAVEHGSVLWSEVQSRELLSGSDSKVDIQSCMTSVLYDPKVDAIVHKKAKCEPNIASEFLIK